MGSYTVQVVEGYEEMSRRAADAVQETIARKPDAVITLPTGQTPVGMYEDLVRRVRAGALDLGQARIFVLDEYFGKGRTDAASLTSWLFDIFLDPAGVPEANVRLVPATADDPVGAAAAYEADLAALGGLDLAVLGLGGNGHIAFNEPGSPPDSRTRVLPLTEESREQSAEYFAGDPVIPDRAMTMGIGTLLEARRIVLIVSGAGKARMVRRALEEEPTLEVPASWLPAAGERLEVILDRDAASALSRT